MKVAKDASKPSVSWLNFETRVSKFPVIGTANAVSITTATGKFLFVCHHKMGDVLELEMEFSKCSKGRQQPRVARLMAATGKFLFCLPS